jgi:hypothetical protein
MAIYETGADGGMTAEFPTLRSAYAAYAAVAGRSLGQPK